MSSKKNTASNSQKVPYGTPAASAILDENTLAEMVYDPVDGRTSFITWHHDKPQRRDTIIAHGRILVPYRFDNALIANDIVLFPSEASSYGSQADLIQNIRSFIHQYLDTDEMFETIVAHYVLLSWVYDRFNELPYLHVQGDYGTGKTRFLQVVGALCYRPTIVSGAATISPIFHLLDQFRGTLVIDEADFRFSDETSEIAKILNCGNAKGVPVLRAQMSRAREFEPHVFQVYGPKIVATRKSYADDALESRFITYHTEHRSVRSGLPTTLPTTFEDEARALRNKLLMYRFKNWNQTEPKSDISELAMNPRAQQIALPLLSIADEGELKPLSEALSSYLKDGREDRYSEAALDEILW